MVYDLRMMRAIMPIQMVFSPYLLRFVPAFSSRFCVVSQTGQFQLLDASASLQTPFIQNVDLATGTSITSFDISNSGQALAFADDAGIIYLYGASDEVVFNNFSQPTEFADPVSTKNNRLIICLTFANIVLIGLFNMTLFTSRLILLDHYLSMTL